MVVPLTNPGATTLAGTIHRQTLTVSVELDLRPDETTVLIGPNGAGKSTIVSTLAGLLQVRSGEVTIAGRVVDAPAANTFVPAAERNVGVVFQDLLLFPHLRVLENVAFGRRAGGTSKGEARRSAAALLESLGLDGLADRRPSELSGGQQQRVALARALAMQPSILVLDEPLSSLDVQTRSGLRRHLAGDLGSFAGPRLLVTHDPADAFLLADRIVVLEDGRIVQDATPEELRRHPASPYAASFSGTNLLSAFADNGVLATDDEEATLQTADRDAGGPVLVSIAPSAIALHLERPHGSPRNSWETVIEAIEPVGDVRRVLLAKPLSLVADLTPGAIESMGLRVGTSVWASVKATEVHVTSAS